MELEDTIVELHKISGIKFGEFKLKGGIMSPVYFDLRVIVSKPTLLSTVSKLLWKANDDSESSDILCGVPYTALPLATLMSVYHDKPSIIRRKEIKEYGTKKIIEGDFKPGQACLIVEDVITSGSSVLETAHILRNHGLVVKDVVVFLDRQQGGKENLESNGIRVHSVTNVEKMMAVLQSAGRVSNEESKTVLDFVKGSRTEVPTRELWMADYETRLATASVDSKMVKKIFGTIIDKKSNLCVAVDVTKAADLLDIVDAVGPFVFCVKTHVDMLEDWTESVGQKLKNLAAKHTFLIFEDRKFADIGYTVSAQYYKGIYKIADWCDIVTIHGFAGPGVIQGLQDGQPNGPKGALIVAEMSCKGNLMTAEFTKKCVEMMQAHKNDDKVSVVGLISQQRLCKDSGCVQMTPGVNLTSKGDNLGQTYVTVTEAILNKGADVIIVGRGITGVARNELAHTAKAYQEEGWKAYQLRSNNTQSH